MKGQRSKVSLLSRDISADNAIEDEGQRQGAESRHKEAAKAKEGQQVVATRTASAYQLQEQEPLEARMQLLLSIKPQNEPLKEPK